MTQRPLTPCTQPGCKALVRGRLCEAHGKAARQESDAKRPSASKRGYGRLHQRWRRMVLRRHPVCAWPGCNEPSAEADHIDPNGARYDLANGQGLCKPHHSHKTVTIDGGRHWGKARQAVAE